MPFVERQTNGKRTENKRQTVRSRGTKGAFLGMNGGCQRCGGNGGGGSWGNFGDECEAGVGGDAVGMAGSATDNPEDGVGGIDKQELGLFVGLAVFVVGEIVAEELGAVCHAEGLEAVGGVPVAEAQGEGDGVGIEGGLIGWQLFGIKAFG